MTTCYVFYLFCLQNDIFSYVHNFHSVMFYMVFVYRLLLFLMYDMFVCIVCECLCLLYGYVSVYVYCMFMCECKNVCFKGCLCMLWYSCPCMVLSLEFGVFLSVLRGVYVYGVCMVYCVYMWFYCMVVKCCVCI